MKPIQALSALLKEAARHVLRRPVIGVAAVAQTADGRYVLIRRRDTGLWALPGGTVEWGETLRSTLCRELMEEAGVETIHLRELCGVYSAPERDWRFHAVTVVAKVTVSEPQRPPKNPLEVIQVGLFEAAELPQRLSHEMTDMLTNALRDEVIWE